MRRGRWSARLEAVAELVGASERVADIGSDHGQLVRRILAGPVDRCIATERDRGRAARLERRLTHPGLAGRVETRAGNGLAPLDPSDGVETITITGLGARSIEGILERGDPRRLEVRRLVVQPQTEPARLRRWLVANGWPLVGERLVRERGRYYEVLAAAPGGPAPASPVVAGLEPDDLLEAGPWLLRSGDPLVVELWRARADRAACELERAAGSPGARAVRRRLARCLRVLGALETAAVRRPDVLV